MDVIYRRPNGRYAQAICFHDEDGKPLEKPLTDQSFKDECDINVLIDRFKRSGTIPASDAANLHYIDFTEVTNFQDAMVKVFEAQDQFDSLDAKIRAKFDNDPGRFLEFASNPANMDELVKMGLAVLKPEYVSGGTTTPVSEVDEKDD